MVENQPFYSLNFLSLLGMGPLENPPLADAIMDRIICGAFRIELQGESIRKKLLLEHFARNILSWNHSGFSIDNSVRILDENSREKLAKDKEQKKVV